MGQQPNTPLSIEDLPRATHHPAAPERWSPDRPGDMTSPGDVPWGGAFGTPGPNTGFALKLIKNRDLPGGDAERADVVAAVVAVASARSSAIGRAPVGPDMDVAIALLGLDDGVEGVHGIAHDYLRLRELVAGIDKKKLVAPYRASSE